MVIPDDLIETLSSTLTYKNRFCFLKNKGGSS